MGHAQADVSDFLAELRGRLSPRGDIISEAGRQKTREVFGEDLSPQAVVERICRDVEARGGAAVCDYSAKLDRANLLPNQLRVSAEELARGAIKGRSAILGHHPTYCTTDPHVPAIDPAHHAFGRTLSRSTLAAALPPLGARWHLRNRVARPRTRLPYS